MQLPRHLVPEIQQLIAASREAAIRSVDHQRVQLYWNIGQKIFQEEQGAKDRADYGAYLIKHLSAELEPLYGSGFSRRQPELFRQFYCTFPNPNTVYSQFACPHFSNCVHIADAIQLNAL